MQHYLFIVAFFGIALDSWQINSLDSEWNLSYTQQCTESYRWIDGGITKPTGISWGNQCKFLYLELRKRVHSSRGESKEFGFKTFKVHSRGVETNLSQGLPGRWSYCEPGPLGRLLHIQHIGSKTLSTLIWNCQIVFVSMLIVVSFMKCVLPVLFVTTDFSLKYLTLDWLIFFGSGLRGERLDRAW